MRTRGRVASGRERPKKYITLSAGVQGKTATFHVVALCDIDDGTARLAALLFEKLSELENDGLITNLEYV